MELFKGLSVDEESIKVSIETKGWNVTARELGYATQNYDNLRLAGRMQLQSHLNENPKTLLEYLQAFEERLDPKVVSYLQAHQEDVSLLQEKTHHLNWKHDWCSASSLLNTYCAKNSSGLRETPFFTWLRVATACHHGENSWGEIATMVEDLMRMKYIPASPTIFNAGFKNGQLSSCFLLTVDDSIDSIFLDGVHTMAKISKNNGGIGVDISRLRHSGINGGGESSGILPWMYILNGTIRAVNQGGKRNGACSVYLRMHHLDVFEFCEAGLKTGDHYSRMHNLNFALWVPDLFMERVKENGQWTLFCPNLTPLLNDSCGKEWEASYEAYEKDLSVPRKTVEARRLLEHVITCQTGSGMPYILYADSCNRKSNQKNLGYIRCGNLCLEIIEFCSNDEIASCNLSSISLRHFASKKTKTFDFSSFGSTVRQVTRNLNRVIDRNFSIDPRVKKSNDRHRPIGIGVSGMAELVAKMGLEWTSFEDREKPSSELQELNKKIFACMYWHALRESLEMSLEEGAYSTFEGSPLSEGKFQFDLWREEFQELEASKRLFPAFRKREDDDPISPESWGEEETFLSNGEKLLPTWDSLREKIVLHGVRNSLLIALMPTASSSLPLKNGETVEAHQSNIYNRRLTTGDFPIVNRYLQWELEKNGLWSREVIGLLKADDGSVARLGDFLQKFMGRRGDEITESIQRRYKTMWELSPKIFLRLAADRARYICQSQSTNVYIRSPTEKQMQSLHVSTYALGLKTGMYYLRQAGATTAYKSTVDPVIMNWVTSTTSGSQKPSPRVVCTEEVCVVCQ